LSVLYLLNKPFISIDVEKNGIYTTSETIVEKKYWIKKSYIKKIETPSYDKDKKVVRFTLKDKNIWIEEYDSYKNDYSKNDSFKEWSDKTIKWDIVELWVWEYWNWINWACVATKAAIEVLKVIIDNQSSWGSWWGSWWNSWWKSSSKPKWWWKGFWSWWVFGKNDIPYKMLNVKTPEYTWFTFLAWDFIPEIKTWYSYEIWYPDSSKFVSVWDNCNETYEKTIKVPELKTIHEYSIYDWLPAFNKSYKKIVKWIEWEYPDIKTDWINSRKYDVWMTRKLHIKYKPPFFYNLDKPKKENIILSEEQAKNLLWYDEWKITCNLSVINSLLNTKSKIKECILNRKQ